MTSGTDTGGRLVRVNPVLIHREERRLSLDGQWRFRLDPDDRGVQEQWFRKPDVLTQTIDVPGCWQGQGFGHDGCDEIWDFQLKTRVFQATYRGTGWYARVFRVPAEWTGQRIWLNFGGVHPSAEAWLNGVRLGGNQLPFVPFGFEVTQVARADADNALVVRVHEKHREFGLAYNWQGNWSGLYRGVELTATGECFIEHLRFYPEVDEERLRVSARLGGPHEGDRPLVLRVSAVSADGGSGPVTAEFPISADTATFEIAVASPQLWSPDTPNLYRVDTALMQGDQVLDAQCERTGFVKLSNNGNKFLVNGEPYYIRGSGDFISCPETGCPDTDRERWRRKLRALREYGYNQVRCQSYVYAPEYFDVADEVGLLVQSEMGMLGAWGGHTRWHVYQWPPPTPDNHSILRRQWNSVVARDVNHPSANMYCMSNELTRGTLFPRTAWQCYRDTKAIKPTAMVIWTDGGYDPDMPGDLVNRFTISIEGDIKGGDPEEAAKCRDKPIVEHEMRWWRSFPDVRISHKYSGAIRHYAAEIAREAAGCRGQERLLSTYAENSQRLQLLEMKGKLEMCRRDHPYLAGFSQFNAMDTNPSPQGIIDEFYEPKLVDAATWSQTNGDTVVLCALGFSDRVLAPGAEFRCALTVSDYSHPALTAPAITWRVAAGDQDIGSGELAWKHSPFTAFPAGEVVWNVPATDRAQKIQLTATLREGERIVTNAWDLWVFPAETVLPPTAAVYGQPMHTWLKSWYGLPCVSPESLSEAGVVLTERLDEPLVRSAQDGGTVVLAASEGLVRPHWPNFGFVNYFFTPPANYGPYEDGQNGTVVLDHPMLGGFPHEGFADLQCFRMIDNAPPLDLEPFGLADEDPVIRAIHRYPVCRPLAYLLERRVGNGRLILSALELNPAWPEARYLLGAICSYAAGDEKADCPELCGSSLNRLVEMTTAFTGA